MGKKRSNRSKRSLGSLPKGLINRKGVVVDPGNPFELTARQKRPKHLVHNRPVSKPKSTQHALESLQRRQTQLRSTMKLSKKANMFVDRRIGQYDPTMSKDDRMLARLVKERTRQSQRVSKFRLNDTDNDGGHEPLVLTHKGKRLDPNKSEALYSDDEDDFGNLEAVDTELHFGGSGLSSSKIDPYGGSSSADLSQVYSHRKTELDDLIARRKVLKAERMQAKETQIEKIEKMDEEFAELSQLLQYRKNEAKPIVAPKPSKEDKEMNDWNKEMKMMMMKPKKKATDRTKTPEEIAKEEAERLHELETRRLARMNGDFEEDDLSDISEDDYGRSKRKRKKGIRNPDELSDSDNESEEDDQLEARFTGDGLKYVNKEGKFVDTNSDNAEEDDSDPNSPESYDKSNLENTEKTAQPLSEGTRIRGNYRAAEQFDGHQTWYEGVISRVNVQADGGVTYDVDYDDGDFEENMLPKNVRPIEKTAEERLKMKNAKSEDLELKIKRNKARDRARKEIPFVFEVPTTLEALHEVIAKYATTGNEVSTIIQRIHKANSVRLDHRNGERMQNFYDVLLRRFVAVGDAVFSSGDGGEELGRFEQLTCLTKVMYAMAQDSPESAGAVWSRRLGIFQSAHAKRLRDAEFAFEEYEDEELITSWPSMGTFLLLRALGHIFPVTDRRHYVVTPAILLLGQMIAQTPVRSNYDLVMGVLCSGLLLEYTREAKRVAPEALAFLAGTIRLFSSDPGQFAIPILEASYNLPEIKSLRDAISGCQAADVEDSSLKLKKDFILNTNSNLAVAVLSTSLHLIEKCIVYLQGSFSFPSDSELLFEVSESILSVPMKRLPEALQRRVGKVATLIAEVCPKERLPLQRRGGPSTTKSVIKSLAPRMYDPEKYSMSKDKGKKSLQAAIDRTRREYKREHKAISRELRLDASFIENERRAEKDKKDASARAKRQKNFAWLEGEQATMNQQVRQGGGLLKGGGTGLARAKAATARLGIKKGGRF